jgi:hypothetical protein
MKIPEQTVFAFSGQRFPPLGLCQTDSYQTAVFCLSQLCSFKPQDSQREVIIYTRWFQSGYYWQPNNFYQTIWQSFLLFLPWSTLILPLPIGPQPQSFPIGQSSPLHLPIGQSCHSFLHWSIFFLHLPIGQSCRIFPRWSIFPFTSSHWSILSHLSSLVNIPFTSPHW